MMKFFCREQLLHEIEKSLMLFYAGKTYLILSCMKNTLKYTEWVFMHVLFVLWVVLNFKLHEILQR